MARNRRTLELDDVPDLPSNSKSRGLERPEGGLVIRPHARQERSHTKNRCPRFRGLAKRLSTDPRPCALLASPMLTSASPGATQSSRTCPTGSPPSSTIMIAQPGSASLLASHT